MSRKIKLSYTTSKKLAYLLSYLEKEWSSDVKNDFINKLDKSLSQISKFPDSYPKSSLVKGLHKCLLTKQTVLFYKYTKDEVYVVTVFDSRQDPDILKNELK